jgi:hypothetical protein
LIDKRNFYENGNIVISDVNVKLLNKIQVNKDLLLVLHGTIYSTFYNGKYQKFCKDKIDEIRKIFLNLPLEDAIECLDGRYVGVLINFKSKAVVFNDKHGQIDLYYAKGDKGTSISTNIDQLICDVEVIEYDQVAIASILGVYGNYSPKKHTIYKNIRRAGVGDSFHCLDGDVEIVKKIFTPKKTENYGHEKHNEYYELLTRSIESRATKKGTNWIYMSSGWDSSAVLAILCNIQGIGNIRAVIGRAKYSNRSGVCNDFEVERAKKITGFFNIPLDVVDLDYTSNDYLDFWDEIRNDFKSNHLYALFSYNFFRLAKYIKDNGNPDDAVFNGELSDGAHNLGFSQFATILDHKDLGFREYSDKMASYLFGPSFFKKIIDGESFNDFIFKLLADKKNIKTFNDAEDLNDEDWKYKYIASFFLSPDRFPFSEIFSNKILSSEAKELCKNEINKTYFKDFNDCVKPETLYSWLLHLYHSFHWQGGTVRGMMMSSEYYGMQTSAPFSDNSILDFLSKMPESWGRGLDLNNTKYPLKWVLSNKVKYPMQLQTGPHSYLYDVDPDWSADSDIIYDSAGAEYFKLLLKNHPYEEILDPKYFNMKYINQLVDNYCNGIIESGQKRTDLKNIISLCNVGWY